jgi:hypothetical protein
VSKCVIINVCNQGKTLCSPCSTDVSKIIVASIFRAEFRLKLEPEFDPTDGGTATLRNDAKYDAKIKAAGGLEFAYQEQAFR